MSACDVFVKRNFTAGDKKKQVGIFFHPNKLFFETPLDTRLVKNENHPNMTNLISLERTQKMEQTVLKHYTPYMKWKSVTRQNRYW